MIGFMFHALQEQAKKNGYMILHTDDGRYAVANLNLERIVGVEDDICEVADLLGLLCEAFDGANDKKHCEEKVSAGLRHAE